MEQLFEGSHNAKPDAIIILRNIHAVTCSNKLLIKKDDKLDLVRFALRKVDC